MHVKTYHARRRGPDIPAVVTVEEVAVEAGSSRPDPSDLDPRLAHSGRVYPLPRCTYYGSRSFAWGCSGAGASDLALSVLADHSGVSPSDVDAVIRGHGRSLSQSTRDQVEGVVRLHRLFLSRVLLHLQGDAWRITSTDIDELIEDVVVTAAQAREASQ